MKKKHLVRNLILIIGGFILLLVILAEIFKNDIVKIAIQKGAKTFDVPLSVGDVDFSLIYRFPLATIEFEDLVMTSEPLFNDSIIAAPDTLARISKLYASVDIWKLIDGNIFVKKIDIDNAKFKYIVDSLGNSNFDFLLKVDTDTIPEETSDTTVIQGVYSLEKLTLTDIDIDYFDDFMKFKTSLSIPEVTVKGELKPEGYLAQTEGEVLVKSIEYEDFHLEDLQKSRLLFDIVAMNDTLNVSDITLDAAGAIFKGKGYIVQGDSLYENLTISGTDIDLAQNYKFLSQKLKDDLQLKELGGVLNVSGTTHGYISPNSIPQLDFNIDLGEGVVKYDIYPKVKNINLSVNVVNGYASRLESASVNIKKFHAETNTSKIDVSALVQNMTNIQYDVVADVTAGLKELKPFIPDSLIKDFGGIVSAKISTSGMLPDSITDSFYDYALERTKLNLKCNNVNILMDSIPAVRDFSGIFTYNAQNIGFKGIKVKIPEYNVDVTDGYLKTAFKGKISNYKNMALNIDSLMLKMQDSYFALSGKIKGFEHIDYDLNLDTKLGLSEIASMLPDSIVNSLSGSVTGNVSSKGQFYIDSIVDQAMPLLFENSHFGVSFNSVTVDMPDTIMNVNNLFGQLKYSSDTLWMDRVEGSYSGLDFSADSTTISNLFSAAIQNNKKELFVHGNFGVSDFDYALIDALMTDTVPASEEEQKAAMEEALKEEPYVQNYTIRVNGKAKAKSVKYGDILVENIDTKFLAKVTDGHFVADQLNCNIFGGDALLSLRYEMNDNFRDVMFFKADVNKLNVSRMMDELETYIDQEDFKKENVLGDLTAQVDGKVVLQDYSPVYEEMLLNGDLLLENGALINVKPVMEVEKIPMIGIKGLDKLYFSTLKSNLFLFKNKMYIPRTEIRTSSFDAMFLGMYSFGEDYAYHIRMFLGEILASKSKHNLAKQAKEGGFDEDEEDDITKGRSSLYVVSKSENGKEKAGLDNKKARRNMSAKVKLQKQMVDMRFHPKLVNYDTEQ